MSNEHDERLRSLFAEAQESLSGAEFMRSFLARMERARRLRNMRRIVLAAGCAILAAWIMPSVLATTAAVMHAVAEHSRSYGALIISPAGWALSMLIGFLVLLRSGALRRR